MKFNNKLSALAVIFLLTLLVMLHFLNVPIQVPSPNEEPTTDPLNPVGQASLTDLHITAQDITINKSVFINELVPIKIRISNLGSTYAELVSVHIALEQNDTYWQIGNESITNLSGQSSKNLQYIWSVPVTLSPGEYTLTIKLQNELAGTDQNLNNNEASVDIQINSILSLTFNRDFAYPDRKLKITSYLNNPENEQLNATINFYYYPINEEKQNSTMFEQESISINPGDKDFINTIWTLPSNFDLGRYVLWINITNSSIPEYQDTSAELKLNIIEYPDTSRTPVYMQIWFIVGLIALIIFFLTIIFSLIGIIPQDRLPIQPALVVMAMVIMVIALIGNYIDPEVHLIGAQDIAGMVIIHPITALTAGFLVAGGLEAAGAFAAAADALSRIEKLKIKGFTIFGFTGTVVILTNIPTLIAMPCGRILGAALMPAALFFGYRIAKAMGDARMVGVVVFPFIVNAAASCGPSPLGGIGTIGEGLSKMPIGSFTTAQSTGIMICTGVCALFMRFITFMRPADLSDEDIRNEKEAKGEMGMDLSAETENKDKGTEGSAPIALKEVDSKKRDAAPRAQAAPVAKPTDESRATTAVAKPVSAKPADAKKTATPLAKKIDNDEKK